MTKTNEIALLDKVIAQFGQDSYLGPWLAENRDQLVSDIKNDLPPSAMFPKEANETAAAIVKNAQIEASRLRTEAGEKAVRIVEKANEQARNTREDIRGELRQVARRLEGLV